MNIWIGRAVVALIAGCGKSPVGVTPQHAKPEGCPMYFAGEGLCAAIAWDGEPRSDRESAFRLRFWNPSRASERGTYTAPKKTVAGVLQMKSCGRILRPEMAAASPGVIAVRKIRFIPEHAGHPGD